MSDLKRMEYLRALHAKLEMGEQKRIASYCGCSQSYVYEVLVCGRNETLMTRRIVRAVELLLEQREQLKELIIQVA